MSNRYDYHTHTAFSDDCDVPMSKMIEEAILCGITELAVTDHYDPGYEDSEFPFILDFDAYHSALLDAGQKYADRITIVNGMEIGIMDSQLEECRRAVRTFPYDFIIGSFHCLRSEDLYRYDYSKVNGPELLEDFYTYVNKCLKEYKDYDIVGHLTIIDRYIGEIYDYRPYMDILEDTLKTVIDDGKGLEINTSSFKYGTGIWLPREEVLKLYHELGGEILTFGSDSHRPEYFRDHFNEARDLAKNLGFRYECTFRQRKPEFHKL